MSDGVEQNHTKGAPEADALAAHETGARLRGAASPAGDQPTDLGHQKTRQDTAALEQKGTIPHVAIEHDNPSFLESIDNHIVDFLATSADKSVFDDFNHMADRCGVKHLTADQKFEIENMRGDLKDMFRLQIKELNKLKDGTVNPAQYMSDTLANAARLAETNGRQPGSWNFLKSSQAELFKEYVGLACSEKPLGFMKDVGRAVVGGGPDIAGSALESAYQTLIADNRAAEGFNSNVADVDKTNSITHHFREFMMVGYNRWQTLGDEAATFIDSPSKNPGDVRNGFFGSMVGAALADGKITASEAAGLTTWAYTSHGDTQPLWGAGNKPGNYLDPKDYKIDDWMKAYRARTQ